jgi:Zn-dependent peptidase ImmA (M78 family)
MNGTEIDWLVARLLHRIGAMTDPADAPEPPDTELLEALARNLGAYRVLWDSRAYGTEDGMVEVVGDRILIRIRRRNAWRRERFTLAHEIGHLVLVQPDLKLMAMRRQTGLEDAERFCDAFAAALLMPRKWIEREYGDQPQSLETLFDCSRRTETSLSATLLRLRRSLDWSRSLLHWRRTDSDWRMVGLTGVPYGLYRDLNSTEETRQLLNDLPVGRMGVELPLKATTGSIRADAEVMVRPTSVVGLTDLKEAGRKHRQRLSLRVNHPAISV